MAEEEDDADAEEEEEEEGPTTKCAASLLLLVASAPVAVAMRLAKPNRVDKYSGAVSSFGMASLIIVVRRVLGCLGGREEGRGRCGAQVVSVWDRLCSCSFALVEGAFFEVLPSFHRALVMKKRVFGLLFAVCQPRRVSDCLDFLHSLWPSLVVWFVGESPLSCCFQMPHSLGNTAPQRHGKVSCRHARRKKHFSTKPENRKKQRKKQENTPTQNN